MNDLNLYRYILVNKMALLNVEEQINITMGYLSSLQSAKDINADDFIKNFYKDRLNAEYIVNNNIFDILFDIYFDIYFALNPPIAIAKLTEEIFYDEDGKEVYDEKKKPYVTLNDDAWKANSNRYYYYDILYEANKYYLTNLNSQSTFIDILMGVLTNFILNTNYYYQMLPDPPSTSTTETGETVAVDPSYFRYEHTNLQRSYFIFWKFVFTQLKDIFLLPEEIDIETALRELANNILTYFVQNNLDFVKIIIDIYYNFLPESSTVFTNIDEQLHLISRQALINNEPILIKNNTKSNKENKPSILNKTIDNYTKRRKPISGTTATMSGTTTSGKSKSKFVTQRRKPISGTTAIGITTSGATARDKFKSVTSGKSKSVIKRKPTIDINTIFKLNNPQRELFPIQEQSAYGGGRKRTHRRKKNKRKSIKRKNKKTRKYRKKL